MNDRFFPQSETLTIGQAIRKTKEFLQAGYIDNPALDARLLLQQATGLSQSVLISRNNQPLPLSACIILEELLKRRLNHEPIARLTGSQEFWSLPFALNEDTLIPRPDTETLIELALSLIDDHSQPFRILDLGCGSGCILLSLLSELPQSTGIGSDLSQNALDMAAFNAGQIGINTPSRQRAAFIRSHWFSDIPDENFDFIISNPPYIPSDDIPSLAPDVNLYDPYRALDGGSDGLTAYREIFRSARTVMKDNAVIILEIGIKQDPDVIAIARQNGFYLETSRKDYAGIVRALAFKILPQE